MVSQKFRKLTHKRDIFHKVWILGYANMAKFEGVTSKIGIYENQSLIYAYQLLKRGSKA